MSGFRKPEVAREQLVLWSRRLDDALPADHPARLMDELFRSPALASLFGEWSREYHLLEGQPPYHPRDLAMLYCYGMLNRLRSSRQLESACHNRIDIIWLMSGQKPDHSTIAAFVASHHERVRDLFRRVVRVGIQAGLVKMEHAAIDGTTVEANAGRGSVQREDTIRQQEEQLEKQIAELEKEYHDNESREGLLCVPDEPDLSEDQRLARMREKRARLQRALASIERRRDEQARSDQPQPKPIGSVTDPDSRVMKDKEGRRKPNYNAQLAVDAGEGSAGMIIAADVNDQSNDLGQMMEMIAQTQEACGRLPGEFSLDAGYNTGREVAELEAQGIKAFVDDKRGPIKTPEALDAVRAVREGRTLSLPQIEALPLDPHTKRLDRCCFAYQPAADTYRCPAGQTLTLHRTGKRYDREGGLERKRYRTQACGACPLAARCCKAPSKGREINRTEFEDAKERMKERMTSEEGTRRYKLRGQSVEPRIGTIKAGLGVRKFLRRGREKVRTEWRWACTAFNVGALIRHWPKTKAALA
jgi:transposase